MKKNLNVLVSSCGGDIGQSIGKILKDLNHQTFGLDISKNNPAKFIFDHFEIAPKVADENYINKIKEFVISNKIDLIIPVSEPELRYYTNNFNNNTEINGAKILMANHLSRKIGFNKRNTCQFLKENNLPNPKLYTPNSSNFIFPLIAKPNIGAGSTNVFIVNNIKELMFFNKKYDDIIFQELLDGNQGEFTCCLFSSAKKIRTIIFKRELTAGGYSGYGEVIENKIIERLLLDLARILNLRGSINVQLRLHKGQAVIFEINPRFSSTILFRHLLGFKDLKWSIEDIFDNSISNYTKIRKGSKFYKGFYEYIENK